MKISKETAEHYIWGTICDGWHLVKNKNLSVIHERMPACTSEVKHYHNNASQFFFILKGVAQLDIEGEIITLTPYEGVEIPPLTAHQMFNNSNSEIEFLVISQPTTKDDRVLVD